MNDSLMFQKKSKISVLYFAIYSTIFPLRIDRMWVLKCAVEELKWNQFCSESEKTTKKTSKPHTYIKCNVRMYVSITFESVQAEWLLLENLS